MQFQIREEIVRFCVLLLDFATYNSIMDAWAVSEDTVLFDISEIMKNYEDNVRQMDPDSPDAARLR